MTKSRRNAPVASWEAPEGMRRRFEHPSGRWFALQVIACRLYEAWGTAGPKKFASVSTRNDEADAVRGANAKTKKWLAEGFVERPPEPGIRFDRDADVVATFRTARTYDGKTLFDYGPVPGREGVFVERNVAASAWLVVSADGKRAIELRSVLPKAPAPGRDEMIDALLDSIVARRDEILGDERTPTRKWRLERAIGRFTHLAILSPAAHDHGYFRALGRSLWSAFPCFDCEITGEETVTVAEARCSGHGALPSARWDRAPHPVLDLRTRKRLDRDEDTPFLVYEPRRIAQLLGTAALAKTKGVAIEVRNHAREVRQLARGTVMDDAAWAELTAWLGFDATPAR